MYMGSNGGVLQIKDVPHAIDKDCRSLFALDNLKKQSRKKADASLFEPFAVNYYGDITGPCELQLIQKSNTLIQQFINGNTSSEDEKIDFAGITAVTPMTPNTNETEESNDEEPNSYEKHYHDQNRRASLSMSLALNRCNHILLHSTVHVLHISHYSFEWIMNVNDTIFTEELKSDDQDVVANNNSNITNHYLIGTYQKTTYDQEMSDEFITMGVTSNLSCDDEQYRFYVDDYVQDILSIQAHAPWMYEHDCVLSYKLWLCVVQYAVDCVLPVQYAKQDQSEEITLDDGQLHLIVTGALKNNLHLYEEGIKYLGRKFAEFGRMIDREYNDSKTVLKTEYNKWKKQSYKKRQKPLTMNDLSQKLHRQHSKRTQSNMEPKELKHLYYSNPNFKVSLSKSMNQHSRYHTYGGNGNAKMSTLSTHTASNTTSYGFSFKRLFSFGTNSSGGGGGKKKKKNRDRNRNQTEMKLDYDDANMKSIPNMQRAQTAPGRGLIGDDNVHKQNKLNNNRRKKPNLNNMEMDVVDDEKGVIEETVKMKQVSSLPTISGSGPGAKSASATSAVSASSQSHGHPLRKANSNRGVMDVPMTMDRASNGSGYSHEDNQMVMLDAYGVSNMNDEAPVATRKESIVGVKVKQDIRNAFVAYQQEKGKIADDVQQFVTYCKTRKNIKRANWTHCKEVMDEMAK